MNFSIILYILGWILNFEAFFMTLPFIVALYYGEQQGFAYLITIGISLVLGVLLTYRKPKNTVFYAKEGFVTVSLSWIVLSMIGALPFTISGEIPSYIDALFETISGFTTTGASILSDVEALSKCNLFWRSFTHWVGGMGVLVFVLAILPLNGGYNMYLMKAESPGPSVGKLVPRVRQTAKILYGIYISMTVVEIVLLLIGGLTLFDALTLSFGTAGTGGFGILNSSIASYSEFIRNVITIFMILFGVNFNIYYLFLCKRPKQALKSEELRGYFGIIFVFITIITINVHQMFPSIKQAIEHVAFQVGSIITTTGYSTVDFDKWPELSKTLLVMLMFIGASAGSTGGGIKVSRIMILMKTIRKELMTIIHPRSVKKLKYEDHQISHEVVRSINVFFIAYFVIFVSSTVLISLDNFGFTTNFTSVAATLNNIGPGLEKVGPTQNFGVFSPFSKCVLMFDMLAGRLELFPMLLLFVPSTWRK